MQIEFGRSILALARDGLLALRDAQGTQILCHEGALWVTQEGDIRDIIIGPGDRLTVREPGLTVITAVNASKLTLVESTHSQTASSRPRETKTVPERHEAAACA